MLVLLPAVSFCVLASSAGSKRRSQTGEWSVDVVALAAPIRFMDHILGSQERHLADGRPLVRHHALLAGTVTGASSLTGKSACNLFDDLSIRLRVRLPKHHLLHSTSTPTHDAAVAACAAAHDVIGRPFRLHWRGATAQRRRLRKQLCGAPSSLVVPLWFSTSITKRPGAA